MRRIPLILLLSLFVAAAPAEAIELKPHRAIYSLKLASADSGSGVTDAQGAMVFEWAESCESWTTRQRARFDVYSPEGGSVRTEVSFSSWEGKTNGSYGFNLRTLQDGRVVEDLRGEAKLEGNGGGQAVYSKPRQQRIELPPGTLFPVAHTKLLIQEAMAGGRQLLRPVFLGQREDEPMMVNAVVTQRAPAAHPTATGDGNDLLDRPSWKFHLAFYGADDDLLPAFQIHEVLYDNGVVGDATVIYDEFSFAYTLERLEPLPRPKC